MKTTFLFLTISLLLSLPPHLHAQAPAQAEEKRFNIRFSGGSLEKFLELVKKESGEDLNILMPDSLKRARVSEIRLQSVTVDHVMESLNAVYTYQLGRWQKLDNIWIVQLRPDTRVAQAYYIGHLIGKFEIEDIITAITTTWGLQEEHSKSELKFHPETKLLIALADKTRLSTLTSVLTELEKALEHGAAKPENSR